jgi:chromosome segregation ATPase
MADVDKLAEKGTLLGSVRTMQTQLATKRTEVGAQAERARRLKPKTEISFERYDELAGRLTPTRRLADGLAEARQRAQDSGRVIASCRAAMAAGQVIGRMEDLAGEKDKVLRLKDSLSVLTARALKAAGTVSSAKGNLKSVTEEHSKMIDRMGVCPLSGLEMPQACKAALKGEG